MEKQENKSQKEIDFDEGKALRDKQYLATKDYNENAEEEGPDEEEENEVKQSIAQVPAKMVFQKKDAMDAKLEDFILLRIVGKGTFGKVFQCQHTVTGKIYAMKCIRKDVVLENDAMQSLKLEKEILHHLEHPFLVSMDYVF